MDTLKIDLSIRPCDLNSLLNGRAAYKWQRANKETRERVWEKLKAHAILEFENRDLSIYEVQRFIGLECDDIFYKGLPSYTVQTFTTDGHNRADLRKDFLGPGAYQQALWYARFTLSLSARVTITTHTECIFTDAKEITFDNQGWLNVKEKDNG